MTFGPALDTLVHQWADQPTAAVFAALADGLRKRGALAEAADVLAAGLERFPGWVPGVLVGVRVAAAQGDHAWAEAALRGVLESDPEHPVARELAAALAPGLLEAPPEPAELLFTESLGEVAEGDDWPSAELPGGIVTESLAALFHGQGHLDQALEAYAELVARDPGNRVLAERHEAVLREAQANQPPPLDARRSGGRSVGDWLGAVAAARPSPGRLPPASFDAFYEAPPAPPTATVDFDAFQRWLKELER
jgi:tetratricopeptide (TPR) repeat protein